MNVVLVGNAQVPRKYAEGLARSLLETLSSSVASGSKSVRILLRRPVSAPIGPFEASVAEIADDLGLSVRWCYPDPRGGREGTYVRDAHMVQMADVVFAFFTPEALKTGGTGTEHVVQKAIDKEIPVHAYEIDEDGLRWVGSV